MSKTFNLELTEQEIEALVNLLDAGVRHQGLNAATNAAFLMQKINAAMKPKAEESIKGEIE